MNDKKTGESIELIPWAKPWLGTKEKDYIAKAVDSTWISGGEFVNRFESEFAGLIGKKYAVTTSNGTTALHLALLAAGVGPGDEVIVPAFTFVAAANMTIQVGAKPVYVDIDPETWCIDVRDVRRNINKKTKAIIPVHIYGNVCEMDTLIIMAKENKIKIIEDTAEAVFSKYHGRYTGSFGDLNCFSFQATKTITMGEGGVVLTDDEDAYQQMKILRSHGMKESKRYWHDILGYNYRLTNMQAAIGCAQLENRDKIIREKHRIYHRYFDNLSNIPGIYFQRFTEGAEPVIWTVAIKIVPRYFKGDRDLVMAEMLKNGVETRPGFYPFSVMPTYQAKSIPEIEEIASNIISLPSYATLENKIIDDICNKLLSIMNP